MRRSALLLALVLLAFGTGACRDDGTDRSSASTALSSTTTDADETDTTGTSTGAATLDGLMLAAVDLPGFEAADDVDDTITTFCAGEDATAGLQATEREVRGFQRTGGGASVIQLAFRFREDGAARFVAQAEESLGRCSSVPDGRGLAFDYEPVTAGAGATLIGAADSLTSRYGVSVGSGSLSVNVAVVQRGNVGLLVAVLGLDLPRAELDAVTTVAFDAVAARLP